MSGNYCYIDDKVLRSYIKETFELQDLLIGSKYELICALLIKALFQELYRVECLIGFKVKQTYSETKHKAIADTVGCKKFFKEIEDKDTPVDFCISPVYSFNQKRDKISGWTFQAKRFGKFQDKKDTVGLIEYLEKIEKKYAKTDSALVIFFDGHKGINLEQIYKDSKLGNFPFESIFFIEINQDKNKYWHLKMGQIWPIYGYNAYDVIKAIKNGILENISYKYK